MASCAVEGGCPSDYVAIAVAVLSFLMLLSWSVFPFLVNKVPRTKGSGFWIPVIQVVASFILLLSIVLSINLLKFKRKHWWQSCYVWAVWGEGPLGFGLLLSCRITQAFQLYFIFVKRRLPLVRSYFLLPLILLPWIAGAAFIHMKKPLNYRCHMRAQWTIPVVCLHALYVVTLLGVTRAVRHVEFRFDELRDLWRGILVSVLSIVHFFGVSSACQLVEEKMVYCPLDWFTKTSMQNCVTKQHQGSEYILWVAAYILNEIHDDISWLQVASRFLLLVMASVLIMAFFSISTSQPLLSQISLRRRESREFRTMGQALGIPDSGILAQSEPVSVIDTNEPLDKLLLNKRFRHSFMAFADSCLAGESVHFFDEVHELSKIPEDDSVGRIYMARHIIEKYIASGAAMEVNISHRCRQDILTTSNLARPDLFRNAINEIMQLMKTNLARDFWSSMFFMKFREESNKRSDSHDLEQITGWNFSPRLSSVHGADDPFHHDHLLKSSSGRSHD